MKSVIVLCILTIGFPAGFLLLGAMIALSEVHAASPSMLIHVLILAFVSAGTLGWIVMTPFRWRMTRLGVGALVLTAIAIISLPTGFILLIAPVSAPRPRSLTRAMAENKTQRTKASVTAFVANISDPARRQETRLLVALIRKLTGDKPAMWASIIGFGDWSSSNMRPC